MDIFLGNADGRYLCYELKLKPSLRRIPVLLFSAANVALSSVEDACADGFINKPFDIKSLVENIWKLLGRNDEQ